ncbi:presqualene diphosphate synthase HpnD [Microvirga puerhi]|uniref:Presqualene diphosphate synthase HpnD n=1 Tax=Microvirga puerhi TaxID=2876078 RepID=A0ABS7VSC5_9HYPH|nr:presqualene diphosphate synthase HpnD [Microvirga puerhi]MBZ6077985.1 presqualene diphosphate synthase HpnD [Microvirga puerhi]
MADVALNESGSPAVAGSSFYTAMRILPRSRREAMYAVYAFCRAVDDIADSGEPCADRARKLQAWRTEVDGLFHEHPPERLSALAASVRTFALRSDEFHAVIDGMMMDVKGDIWPPDWATLDLYCDRVASAVGRISVRIFGIDDHHGEALAYHLGRALQLTNILRDLDEDAVLDRLYLPREALIEAGISQFEPGFVLTHPRIGHACNQVAGKAAVHFHEADRVMAECSRSSVRAPRLMAAAYSTILDELLARGWDPPRPVVHIGRLSVLRALLRYGLI